jgi:hypothetical protein
MSKVLFVLSSHSELGSTGRQTGFYIPETAHPYAVFARKSTSSRLGAAGRHRMASIAPTPSRQRSSTTRRSPSG